MPDKQAKLRPEPQEDSHSRRAIRIPSFLSRFTPQWGTPQNQRAEAWRSFVRNQPIAIICRDTLIANLLNSDWEITPKKPDDESSRTAQLIEYHTELFDNLEGSFDNFIELMCQDLLDIPFGGTCEVGRWDDNPDELVAWVEHIDGATLYPTLDEDYPVAQMPIGYAVGKPILFPAHAVERMIYTPRPEYQRRGWGMAPPEKIYLAIEMLYRGDKYYANLLLDTPEAGILDLIDMSEDSALKWLEGFQALFAGIDGFKVPVLYEHTQAAEWIPLNRPPLEMLYDKATFAYAQILCAGYGMRASDIGIQDQPGSKTLAGVIREERQTKRTGFALLREKTTRLLNRLLPKDEIQFAWVDKDDEASVSKGKAMLGLGQGFNSLITAGIISREESRAQLVQEGLFTIEMDPDELPEEPVSALAGLLGAGGGAAAGGGGSVKLPPKVPPSAGGRGELGTAKARGDRPEDRLATPPDQPAIAARMDDLLLPILAMIEDNAEFIRLQRLVIAATKVMVPQVADVFKIVPDEAITRYWLPEMLKSDLGLDSDISPEVTRVSSEEVEAVLDKHLNADPWWSTVNEWDRRQVVDVFKTAFEAGLREQAESIIRSLYLEGLINTPAVVVEFNVTNREVLKILSDHAGEFITNLDAGTKYHIRRVITAGVRQGLARPEIAQAIRDGVTAEEVLLREGYMQDVVGEIRDALPIMSKARAKSIVNYEVAHAQGLGAFEQLKRSGLKQKAWQHLGKRGETAAGNEHPCPICLGNEAQGFVPLDFDFQTVFGPSKTTPGHPGVCHCKIKFQEAELFKVVGEGGYMPYAGGR